MRAWQEKYIQNAREIAEIRQMFPLEKLSWDQWYARHRTKEACLAALKSENTALLNDNLFPLLDRLPDADRTETDELCAFADELMDWKTNLDCGVYVAVHDALLSLSRIRGDREDVIRELYRLGMGLHYLYRSLTGIACPEATAMYFHNEMVFTEAASYLRHFAALKSDEARAFAIRAMANISICNTSYKRRIAASVRTVDIARSPEYRAIAPSLPWQTYLERAYQQLSTLRLYLSSPDITRREVAAVMDACYEMFKPEQTQENPSVRRLWPYYAMEYQCGYVSLADTVKRLLRLMEDTAPLAYDENGLYGNIQLPIHLGQLVREHQELNSDDSTREALQMAYRRMLDTLMAVPPDKVGERFLYVLAIVVSNFYEIEGGVTYREVTARLMQRFAGRLYLDSLRAGELLDVLSAHINGRDPDYFRDLPVLSGITDDGARAEKLSAYAEACGLYHDFGLLRMHLERTMQTRQLFENEAAMYRLHTVSGYEELRTRPSTLIFADVALGHHSAYLARENDPDDPSHYQRLSSPFRRMTDLMALVSDLMETGEGDVRAWARRVLTDSRGRFSPRAAAYLADDTLLTALEAVLSNEESRCRRAYRYHTEVTA